MAAAGEDDLPPVSPRARVFSQEASRAQRRILPGSGKMADRPVPIKDKRLLEVKLGQLPAWLATRDYTPNGFLLGCRAGYDRYYNKYINVKKGGIGGFAMLLTGYVVISYIWSYEHIKHDRWRKYH